MIKKDVKPKSVVIITAVALKIFVLTSFLEPPTYSFRFPQNRVDCN